MTHEELVAAVRQMTYLLMIIERNVGASKDINRITFRKEFEQIWNSIRYSEALLPSGTISGRDVVKEARQVETGKLSLTEVLQLYDAGVYAKDEVYRMYPPTRGT